MRLVLGNEFVRSGVRHFAAVLFQLKTDPEFANFIVRHLICWITSNVELMAGLAAPFPEIVPMTTHLMRKLFLCYPVIFSPSLNAAGPTPFGLISQVTQRGTLTNLRSHF